MKTLIRKPGMWSVNLVFLCLLSVFLFSPDLFSQSDKMRNGQPPNKMLDILEQLEKGKTVSHEDIRAALIRSESDHPESEEPFRQGMSAIPGAPELPEFSFDWDNEGYNADISPRLEMNDIRLQLQIDLEVFRKNIEAFRNSEDFRVMKSELQKLGESLRKEMEEVKNELLKPHKETVGKKSEQVLL
jgi:hypothetical protein